MLAIDKINGLPAHVLLVHAVVVLLPLASLALVLAVLWPAARRRLGIVTPLLALVGLILVPVTTSAGEWFESQLPKSDLIEKHANLGDQLLPYAIGLFVVAAAHWVWSYRLNRQAREDVAVSNGPAGGSGGVAVAERTGAATATSTATKVGTVVFAVLGVVAAALTVWMIVRIGDSGAQAVWKGSV